MLGLELCVTPCTDLRDAGSHEQWLRRDLHPPVTVVSDGASVQRGIGFWAVLLDAAGEVAHFWCHVCVADPSFWAAECLCQALSMIIPSRLEVASTLLLGDNLSAAVNDGLRKPTPSH